MNGRCPLNRHRAALNRRSSRLKRIFFEVPIKLSLYIAGKLAGRNLTSHPYFAYHKFHIQALADALNTQANSKKAIEAFNNAVAAADASTDFNAILAKYKIRTEVFGLQYLTFVDVLRLLEEVKSGMSTFESFREIGDAGLSAENLLASEVDLEAWRANWAGLYMETLELLAMSEVEYGAADEAMTQFKKILMDMQSGSNMSRIGSYATERDMYWQQYERMKHPSAQKPEQAIMDPSRYARTQRDKVDAVARALATMCDLVFSDNVRDRNAVEHEGAKLSRAFAS